MKPTIKSINEALPRFDHLRRHYMVHGTTGLINNRCSYLASAFADTDDSGNVSNIALYAVGDAYERKHYYSEQYDNVFDITDIIERAIACEDRYYSINYNPKRFRLDICREIQDRIAQAL